MTYHDHGHPIKTNTYKSVKNEDIDLKLSGYKHMVTWDYFGDLPSPGQTKSYFPVTYHDHGHPIKTNPYKSSKIKILT